MPKENEKELYAALVKKTNEEIAIGKGLRDGHPNLVYTSEISSLLHVVELQNARLKCIDKLLGRGENELGAVLTAAIAPLHERIYQMQLDQMNASRNIQITAVATTISLMGLQKQVNSLNTQMDQANRMIAQNMFAIVRMEIAMSGDAIINAILAVKRLKTGSGTAAVAITVTGTLVMIAGNVLSGGGMSVLGGILAATGAGVAAFATNDIGGILTAALAVGTTTEVARKVAKDEDMLSIATATDGFDLTKAQEPEGKSKYQVQADLSTTLLAGIIELSKQAPSFPTSSETPSTQTLSRTPSTKTLSRTSGTTNLSGRPSFKREYKRTAFKRHGNGGTSAIIYDVQNALVRAYIAQTYLLSNEIDEREGALLRSIAEAPLADNIKNTLHPLTKAVLINALKLLHGDDNEYREPDSHGYTVDARRGVTSMFRTNAPIPSVKQGYEKIEALISADLPLPDGTTLVALLTTPA
jgi:hypothetical protein